MNMNNYKRKTGTNLDSNAQDCKNINYDYNRQFPKYPSQRHENRKDLERDTGCLDQNPQQQNCYRQNATYHYQNRHKRRTWKRAHEKSLPSKASPTPTTATRSSEDSPVFKRQLQKQISNEPQSQKEPRNKKKPESLLKVEQNLKEIHWNEIFSQALKKMENCKNGDEVNILLSTLQAPRGSWNKDKEQISNDLFNLMSPLGIEQILVFGSTLTALDFIGSDLDYHVKLKRRLANNNEVKEVINKTAKLARSQNKNFRVIYTILNARVPIIRLLHLRTRIICDVNFTSCFGYYNSRFISSIMSFDCRIRDLAVILKLWSKSHKIAERMIMSNYCLVMLLIFYLQNLEQPMLDSIKNSQASQNPIILDNKYRWNVSFNDKINLTQQNQLSLRQLLIGFFEFYHKLNFVNYIVSVYTGDLIRRDEFNQHPDFVNYRQILQSDIPPLQFDNSQQFVVQDGFEQNLNIGIRNQKSAMLFFDIIEASYKICRELKQKPFSELLTKLFTEIEMSKTVSKKAKKKFVMTVHSVANDLKVRKQLNQLLLFLLFFFYRFVKIFLLPRITAELTALKTNTSSFIEMLLKERNSFFAKFISVKFFQKIRVQVTQ